ncbi:hypothetical protein HYPBUDRAFT_6958 [Hyphopichia burtonii NRRL Y-1933]|uniref:Uncharacterized protein n=1 Tax=Hyphopichia burtonii NRRL Y-1933 TaxID=984485 RepID=A0A1E4RH24_9ASCO|nr:hypothetical protein HYPBUDRAFT_6958 [Hyphopichia burtonii NRRL Y-1933]ODV66560.1 hypothetical protein HYPBUDRAFT_6958 [Hyphopichia burtonii NRRL Y-1933]
MIGEAHDKSRPDLYSQLSGRQREEKLDDFQRLDIQRRRNQRNRVNFIRNGNIVNKRAESTQRPQKRVPLADKSNLALSHSRPKLPISKIHKITKLVPPQSLDSSLKSNPMKSVLKNQIMEFHKQPLPRSAQNDVSSSSMGVKISTLSSVIKSSPAQNALVAAVGKNNGYFEITRDILNRVSYQNITIGTKITDQASNFIRTFIEWYKANKYNFVVVQENINEMVLKTHQHLSQAPESYANPYFAAPSGILEMQAKHRPIESKNYPTHIVEKATSLGKYLVCAKVRCTKINKIENVFLANTDTRVHINANDLLVLKKDGSSQQVFNGKPVSVYLNWLVYKESPLSVDFFG